MIANTKQRNGRFTEEASSARVSPKGKGFKAKPT